MGEEPQFSRVKVAPVVAEIFAGTLSNDPPAAIGLELIRRPYHHARSNQMRNMKKHIHLVISVLSVAIFALLAPTSFAQKGDAMSKAQAIAKQLNLTPQQKEKILPILAAEVPKVRAIKNDNSLSNMMKMQQLRAIHQQSDPQMKAILSPEQYQKLQGIRRQTIREAVQSKSPT